MTKITPAETAEINAAYEQIAIALESAKSPFLSELLQLRSQRPAFFLGVSRLLTLDVHGRLRSGLNALDDVLEPPTPVASEIKYVH